MKLNTEQMTRQKTYESSLFFVRQMLSDCLISESEFETAKGFLEAKYCPLIRH